LIPTEASDTIGPSQTPRPPLLVLSSVWCFACRQRASSSSLSSQPQQLAFVGRRIMRSLVSHTETET